MIINDKSIKADNNQQQTKPVAPADPKLQSSFEQNMTDPSINDNLREQQYQTKKALERPESHKESTPQKKLNTSEADLQKSQTPLVSKEALQHQAQNPLPSMKKGTLDKNLRLNKEIDSFSSKSTTNKKLLAENLDAKLVLEHTSDDTEPETNKDAETGSINTQLDATSLDNEDLGVKLKNNITDTTNPNEELTLLTTEMIKNQNDKTIFSEGIKQNKAAPTTNAAPQGQMPFNSAAMTATNKELSAKDLSLLAESLKPDNDKNEPNTTLKTPNQLLAQISSAQIPAPNLGDRILEQLEKRVFDPEQLQALLNKIVTSVESLKQQGLSQSKMQLQLPQLGQMELQLNKLDNTLQVIILSQPGAQQLMQAAKNDLFERLQQQFPDQELELDFGEKDPDSEQGSRHQRSIYDELEDES